MRTLFSAILKGLAIGIFVGGIFCKLVNEAEAADDVVDPGTGGDGITEPFPNDPTDGPSDLGGFSPFPMTMTGNRNDSVNLMSRALLYETLISYGVLHYVEAQRGRLKYKGIFSQFGYFEDLDDVAVNYAVAEFTRFFSSHLCGQRTPENFFKAFNQFEIPDSKGLSAQLFHRFHYDLAWALLGNGLPREPNKIMELNTQWNILKTIPTSLIPGRELVPLISSISSIVSTVRTLNRSKCFVNLREDPAEVVRKRIIIRRLLEMEALVKQRYRGLKPYADLKNKAKSFMASREVSTSKSSPASRTED